MPAEVPLSPKSTIAYVCLLEALAVLGLGRKRDLFGFVIEVLIDNRIVVKRRG